MVQLIQNRRGEAALVAVLALAGCEAPVSLDCANAEKLTAYQRFKGEEGPEQMRAFCAEHPRGVSDVSIHVDTTPLTHLSLPCVCSLSSLQISNNPELVDLTGLENVSRMSGAIKIEGNPKLQSLVGLPQAEELGELGGYSIHIDDNDRLVDLSGLPGGVRHMGGSIRIRGNDSLTSLEGFPRDLETIDGGIAISGSPQLSDLRALPQRVETLKSLKISGSDRLTGLDGLPSSLKRIDGQFWISAHTALRHLRGVPPGLESVGELNISSNEALVDLSGLPEGLEIKTYLRISFNNSLRNLAGLPEGLRIGAAEFDGPSLVIEGNENLEDLSGLPASLTSIPGRVTLSRTRCKNLAGLFDHLRSVGGLELLRNDELEDLSGIPEGTTLGKDNRLYSLYVVGNDGLVDLSGLPASFGALPGSVTVVDNANLVDLSGLEVVRSVGGDLFIGKRYPINLTDPCVWDLEPGGNPSLKSLAGLSALESVGGTLAIACSPALQRLDAFGELRAVGQHLILADNIELSDLSNLGGPGGELRTIGGVYRVRCAPGLDHDEAAAVVAEIEGEVNMLIELPCG